MRGNNLYKSTALAIVMAFGLGIAMNSSVNADQGATFPNCGATKGYSSIGIGQSDVTGKSKYYAGKAYGNADNCVKDIQRALNAGFCSPTTRISTDGIYGSRTAQAVTNYQRYYRSQNIVVNTGSGYKAIYIDGEVGPQTWSLLNSQMIYQNPVWNCRG